MCTTREIYRARWTLLFIFVIAASVSTVFSRPIIVGLTSSFYIKDSLKSTNVKVSKLAQGLPVGGEIESLDDGTLFSAFKNRTGIKANSD